MVRTQIQLPNDLYARAKAACEVREISMAELARRGIEYMLSVYPATRAGTEPWCLPEPRNLGWRGLSDAEIKKQAQLTSGELLLHGRDTV
jgi:hypothetical protein